MTIAAEPGFPQHRSIFTVAFNISMFSNISKISNLSAFQIRQNWDI